MRFIAICMLIVLTMLPSGLASATDEVKIIYEEGSRLLLEKIADEWRISHPDLKLSMQEWKTDDCYELFNDPAAMTSSGADIFLIRSNLTDLDALLDAQAISSLESSALQEQVKAMYPQFGDYLLRDGQLRGFPVYLSGNYMMVRQNLHEANQLPEIPKTLDAYFDQMADWWSQGRHTGTQISFNGRSDYPYVLEDALTMLLIQYLHARADRDGLPVFNTPELAQKLEKLAFFSKRLDLDAAQAKYVPGVYEHGGVSPVVVLANADPIDELRYVLPPAFDEEQKQVINAYLAYFVISSGTQQREAAEDFVEIYSKLMPEDKRIDFYPDAAVEENSRYTAEMIQAARDLAPYIDLTQGENIGWLFNELEPVQILMQYYAGEATAAEVIDELDAAVAAAAMP